MAHEAAAALAAGLHVFCFSDGVSLEVEAQLKRQALERGLLFMGADCGAAIIDGVALGFANAVERGPVASSAPPAPAPRRCAACSTPPASGVASIGVGGRDPPARSEA